ncbi:MAG: hypothetical protein V5786_05435 [Psychromonas sp.]
MNTKKALKKLKKKASKVSKHSVSQLSKTMMNTVSINDELKHEIKQLSQQALSSAISELSTPLTPLLSWFNGGTNSIEIYSAKRKQATPSIPVNNQYNVKTQLAQFPLKSPPCKSCPARENGLCKCAMKKLAS